MRSIRILIFDYEMLKCSLRVFLTSHFFAALRLILHISAKKRRLPLLFVCNAPMFFSFHGTADRQAAYSIVERLRMTVMRQSTDLPVLADASRTALCACGAAAKRKGMT